MPRIDGIAASNVAPPRETKPQRAPEQTSESKPTANSSRPDDSEKVARDEKTTRPEPAQKPAASVAAEKPVSSPYKARLNYDIENEDIYIEILSPRTGEVLQRLPPEDALDPLLKGTDGKAGAVLDQVA